MSKIVDRFKEISKELETAAPSAAPPEQVPIIAAILTAGEATETLAKSVSLLLEDYDAQPGDAQPGDAPVVAGPTQTGTIETDDDDSEPDDDDDNPFEGEPEYDPPVLKGKHPVSLLQEVCQERMLEMPEYEIVRLPSADHVTRYAGTVTIEDVGKSRLLEGKACLNHPDTKRALARIMLVEHFGAKEGRKR